MINFFSSQLLSFDSVTGAAPSYLTTRSFFLKYYSIAFSILPGIAGGLAKELISWILSFGDGARVVKPKWLIDIIKVYYH